LLAGQLWSSPVKFVMFESSLSDCLGGLSTLTLGAPSSCSFMGKVGAYLEIFRVLPMMGLLLVKTL